MNIIQVNITKAMAADWLSIITEYFGDDDSVSKELIDKLMHTGSEYTHVLVSLSQSDLVVMRRALLHHETALSIDLSRVALDIKQLDDFALLAAQQYGHRDGSECKE